MFNGQVMVISKPETDITAVGEITNDGRLFGNWGGETEQHAGYYELPTGSWVQLPDIPGYPLNFGSRMNDQAQAVGYACRNGTFDLASQCDAWSWDGSKYSVYSHPGALSTFAYGLNDKGREVGLWDKEPNVYIGYSRFRGTLHDLVLSAYGVTFTAYDINNNGDILAAAPLDPTGYWPSFIYHDQNGIERLPNYPGVLRTFYQKMNEREDLVGIWFNDASAFPTYGFVALRK